jgi:hypothetical protein
VNLSLLFRQLKNLDEILAAHGVEVEALAASSRYEEPVKALTCYSNRLGVTRQGNRYLRKVACAREMVGFVNVSNDL